MVDKISYQCPAKINLFLKVVGKDQVTNFYELESVLAKIDLCDELEVAIYEKNSEKVGIFGEFASLVDKKDNIFTKILDFFVKNYQISRNLRIKITKNIPVGAGLGGGSSDAAYFMVALNEIFQLGLNKTSLQEISFNFGSDIAFFFEDKPAIIRGRGFVSQNIDLQKQKILLINPKIEVLTKEIFADFNNNFSSEINDEKLKSMNNEQLFALSNDLEVVAKKKLPKIAEIIDILAKSGAKIAKMSGSGASCFGIFDADIDLDKKREEISGIFPDYFVTIATIIN